MISGLREPRPPEIAKCTICGELLDFPLGPFGQTQEQCRNRRCVNNVPHRPQPEAYRPRRMKSGEGPRGRAARARGRNR